MTEKHIRPKRLIFERTDKRDYPLSFEKTKRKLGKEKSSADEKLPEFSRNCGKNFNSSTDRKALSVSSNRKFLLIAIAREFLTVIFHRRVLLKRKKFVCKFPYNNSLFKVLQTFWTVLTENGFHQLLYLKEYHN